LKNVAALPPPPTGQIALDVLFVSSKETYEYHEINLHVKLSNQHQNDED
jgi:hypothetical protein